MVYVCRRDFFAFALIFSPELRLAGATHGRDNLPGEK
jgi:hypothetical protein